MTNHPTPELLGKIAEAVMPFLHDVRSGARTNVITPEFASIFVARAAYNIITAALSQNNADTGTE